MRVTAPQGAGLRAGAFRTLRKFLAMTKNAILKIPEIPQILILTNPRGRFWIPAFAGMTGWNPTTSH